MAKKQDRAIDAAAGALGDSPFRPTEPEDRETVTVTVEEPAAQVATTAAIPAPAEKPRFSTGDIKNAGVGLREGEIEALDKIAKRWGVGRNFVTRWMVIVGLTLDDKELIPVPPRKLP